MSVGFHEVGLILIQTGEVGPTSLEELESIGDGFV